MGVDPATAYRMATFQPAAYYRIDQVTGSLTPGRLADLQLLPDLAQVCPEVVIVGGQVVAQDGRALFDNDDVLPAWTRDSVRLDPAFGPDTLRVPAAGPVARVQAVEMYDGYFKRGFHVDLPVAEVAEILGRPEGTVKAQISRGLRRLRELYRDQIANGAGLIPPTEVRT